MLTSLHALLRLVTLRWLGVFACALAVLLSATSTASALEPAQSKTCVWGFDFAEHNSVGLFRAATPRTHLENRSCSSELASGSLLAARAAGGGTTRLYRAVSHAEFDELMKAGKFAAGPNSLGGKFFAESAQHAAQWGERLQGAGNYRIITADVPTSAAGQFMRWAKLDAIGPARYAELEQLGNAVIGVFK